MDLHLRIYYSLPELINKNSYYCFITVVSRGERGVGREAIRKEKLLIVNVNNLINLLLFKRCVQNYMFLLTILVSIIAKSY